MIISSNDHETRVAILEDDLVAELFVERERSRGVAGNVYKGRVSKVLPGMQSSFVDIGLERDGFLYVTDVVPSLDAFDGGDEGEADEAEQAAAPVEGAEPAKTRRRRPPGPPRRARSREAPTRRASPGTSRRSRTCSRKGRT